MLCTNRRKLVLDGRMAQYTRTGIGAYISDLVSILARIDRYEITVLLAKNLPCTVYNDIKKIKLLSCAPAYGDYFLREYWEQIKLPNLLNELNADIYHSPNYYLPFIKSTKAALVVTLYDAGVFATPEIYKIIHRIEGEFLIRRSARRADAIIFGSKHAQNEFRRYLGAPLVDKGRSIHMGLPVEVMGLSTACAAVDVESAKRKFGLKRRYVIAVGSIHPRKNYERLIEAMARPEMQSFELVICGAIAWKAQGIFDIISKHGLKERVKIAGFVETSDMVALVKGAEVMAFPSIYEGFGIPPLEAFALDVPVCASNISSIPEVVESAAVLFDPYSVEDIAKTLAKVANDSALKSNLVVNGRARLANFSWERCAQEHMEVYEQAIHWRRGRA